MLLTPKNGTACFTFALFMVSTAIIEAATSLGQAPRLTGVVAISPSDAWAVGNTWGYTRGGVLARTLAEHWDGAQWKIVATPTPHSECGTFSAVTAITSTDVWAAGTIYEDVGNCGIGSQNAKPGFLVHWDGVSWQLVDSPNPVTKRFTGITAIATNDVWAVGYNEPKYGEFTPLTEHWDGTEWTVVPSDSMAGHQGVFEAVTALSLTDVWAVGTFYLPNTAPFVQHWDTRPGSSPPSHPSLASCLVQVLREPLICGQLGPQIWLSDGTVPVGFRPRRRTSAWEA